MLQRSPPLKILRRPPLRLPPTPQPRPHCPNAHLQSLLRTLQQHLFCPPGYTLLADTSPPSLCRSVVLARLQCTPEQRPGHKKPPKMTGRGGARRQRTNRDRGADRMQVLPVPLPLPLPPIYEKAELYLVRNHTLSRARTHVAHAQRTGWPSFREMATFRSRCLFVLRSAYHSRTEWA